ncbi:MAG TPA: outer membrane beta-barrel protein, partial [Ramlibacter sp.]|nr:outer membrane beta-barrel protein [Ramlibacter sp.]
MTVGKYSRFAYRLGAIGLAVFGATSAMAQFAATPHWYVGGSAGRAWADFEHAPFIGVAPGTVRTLGDEDRDTAFKIFGGYQFTPMFSAEFGYFDLGRYDYFYTATAGSFRGESRFQGLNLDLVGRMPFGDRFSALARIGGVYNRARSSVTTTGTVPTLGGSQRENSLGVKVGLGLEYAFTPQLSVRAEVERYRLEDPIRRRGNIDTATLGLVYRFGAPTVTRVVAPPPPPPPPP